MTPHPHRLGDTGALHGPGTGVSGGQFTAHTHTTSDVDADLNTPTGTTDATNTNLPNPTDLWNNHLITRQHLRRMRHNACYMSTGEHDTAINTLELVNLRPHPDLPEPVADAQLALDARHLVGHLPGWDRDAYDALTLPWRTTLGPLHPHDPEPNLDGWDTHDTHLAA